MKLKMKINYLVQKEEVLENDIEKIIEEGKNKKIKKEMLKSLYPTFKNPVDFVQYLEVDKIVELINNEMNNFTVQNHRKKKIFNMMFLK